MGLQIHGCSETKMQRFTRDFIRFKFQGSFKQIAPRNPLDQGQLRYAPVPIFSMYLSHASRAWLLKSGTSILPISLRSCNALFAKLQILIKFQSKRNTEFFRRSRLRERLRGVCGAEFAKCGECAIPNGSEKCKIKTSCFPFAGALLSCFPFAGAFLVFFPATPLIPFILSHQQE